MQISIKTNLPEVQRALAKLHTDIATKATASAINKTLAQAKTQMAREIASEFNLPQSEIKARLSVRKAHAAQGLAALQGALEARDKRGRSLNVIRFVERVVTKAEIKARRKGGTLADLRVRIKRGTKKTIKGAFIANKGRTVFRRVGAARLPIEAVQTVGVAQMFNTRRLNAAVVRAALDKFPKVFEHEAGFYLRKFNGK